MIPFPVGDAWLTGIGVPLLFGIPGVLLLLPLTPGWGWLPRIAVGVAAGMALVTSLAWGGNAVLGFAFDARLAWGAWLLATLAGLVLALVARREWLPLPPPRMTRRHGVLLLILLGAALLASHPHWDHGLPLHQDEWTHLSVSKAMTDQASIQHTDPHLGLWTAPFDAEIAYHILLGESKLLLGVDWLALMWTWPVVIMSLLTLAAYCSGEREGYGLEAAFLVALLPTSVTILGPQFTVPLAFGLFLIPATFLLFTSARPARTLWLVGLLVVFLFFAHPQSAAAAGILIGTFALLQARRGWKRTVALAVLAILPFILGLFVFAEHVQPETLANAVTGIPIPEFIGLFGPIAALLFVAGVYLTFLAPNPERLAWVATSFAHLLLIGLFLVFHLGQHNLYDRAWMHGMLTMSMTGGYALHRLRTAGVRTWWTPSLRSGVVALVVVLAVLLALGGAGQTLPGQWSREANFYTVLSDKDYEVAVWARDHIPHEGSRVLIDPWQGSAFNSVTGLHVYAENPFGGPYQSTKIYNNPRLAMHELAIYSTEEKLLQRWNVTHIVTFLPVNNSNFTYVHEGVWERVQPHLTS